MAASNPDEGAGPPLPSGTGRLREARWLLGARPRRKVNGQAGDDDVRTYGHIIVDEAQDLSPMQLRMLARRSLGGCDRRLCREEGGARARGLGSVHRDADS